MAQKTSRACTVGQKLKNINIFFKFQLEIDLHGYLDKFLT